MATDKVQWRVKNGVLGLETAGGDFEVLPAEQIYRMAVEGQRNPTLVSPTIEAVPGVLSFSRYPLSLELRIQAEPGRSTRGLTIGIYATGGNVCAAVPFSGLDTPDHLVAEGVWYPLALGAIEEVTSIMERVGLGHPGDITLRQYLALLHLKGTHPLIHDFSGSLASAERLLPQEGPSQPPGFVGSLFPYQLDGWRWLELIAEQGLGGILADEMGLGKTVQIIAMLAAEKAAHRGPSLVVAPGTLLENWRREVLRFAPSLSVTVHRGPSRTGFPVDLKRADLTVTSYDTLTRDESLFRQIQWNLVVLDEAQAIKNRDTQRAIAAKRIPRRVGIAVTGTPVENRLGDLWSIVDFALPGFLGDPSTFEHSFADDVSGARVLEPLVSPILLRRKVVDVAQDLPARIDIPQALELSSDQAAAYEAIRQSIQAEYGGKASLVALTRLRMFCAHPWLIEAGKGDPRVVSTKYERLTEIVAEILEDKEKALIFTSFNAMTDLLVQDLHSRFGVPTTFIDGRKPIPERQPIVDFFAASEGAALLVLNPRAAGVGLNIAAANHVIHYNLEWNPAVEDQASARAYRRGQTRPVTVHRLFYINTVEEIMDQRLGHKRLLSGTAVVGVDGSEDHVADIRAAIAKSPVVTRDSDGH